MRTGEYGYPNREWDRVLGPGYGRKGFANLCVSRLLDQQIELLAQLVLLGFLLLLYPGLPFLLNHAKDAILFEPDLVAIVVLLRELSASPSLIVLSHGDSLFVGATIVPYSLACKMLSGVKCKAVDFSMLLVDIV